MQVSKFAFQRRILDFSKQNDLDFSYLERALANAVLAQIIGNTQVISELTYFFKGGSGLIFRFGLFDARTTKDLDMALSADKATARDLISQLDGAKWDVFRVAGVKEMPVGAPAEVDPDAIISRFKVQTELGESEWRSVLLEVGVTTSAGIRPMSASLENEEITRLFEALNLGKPKGVPVITSALQIAEKIQGALAPNSKRGQDIYDAILLADSREVSMQDIADFTRIAFEQRHQSFSAAFEPSQKFKQKYFAATSGLKDAPEYEVALERFRMLLLEVANAMAASKPNGEGGSV